MIRIVSLAGTVAAFLLSSWPAQALNTRTWVSGTGVDSAGCGSIATPCRTLQYAHDNTSPGGEIDVKDSAGYGTLIINKSISVNGNGSLAGLVAGAGQTAVFIVTGLNDKIVLRGLTIQGAGIAGNGIVFYGSGILHVADCVIENFHASGGGTGNGIFLAPPSGSPKILIANTSVSNNESAGIYFVPQSGSTAAARITIDRVTVTGNTATGFYFYAGNTSGATIVNISNSIASQTNGDGMSFSGALLKADIDLCEADGNFASGYASYSGTLAIGRSRGSNNYTYGLHGPGGGVTSHHDNRFNNNGSGPTSGSIGTAGLY